MFDLDAWQEIWVTITRNKLRSFLTAFGVFWGLFMLVVLIGMGNGLQGGILKNFDGFASNSCFVNAGRTSEAYKGYRKGRTWNLDNRDVELIRERATAVEYISPVLFGRSVDKNAVRGRKSGTYGFRGIYDVHFKIEQMHILKGRLFNELDAAETRKVCVIGKDVYETLFEIGEDPVGEYIRLNGIYFQVVGVISPKSNASIGGNIESTVFLPFTTMQVTFNQGNIVHFIACTAKKGIPVSVVEDQVGAILKGANNISPTDTKALRLFNIEKQFKLFEVIFSGMNILILIVGAGALLSGVIGISNIMMVTVRERTREIGVRRAIGAKPLSIAIQILSESFVLTAIAGIFGFLVGIYTLDIVYPILTNAFPKMLDFFVTPQISFNVAMKSMLILVVSGLLAGLMPVMRALKIKAIDAIRDE